MAPDGAEEGGALVAVPRTAQGVTHLVAEGGDARHLADIGLHGQFSRISATAGTPTLTIDEDVAGQCSPDGVHRLDVVHAHQVEAETVDVVLVHPVFHALDHELAHALALAGRLVATTAAVAVGAIGILAVVVVGTGELEVAAVDVPGVVINHIEDDLDARFVQGLDHLLELADAHLGLIGVGGVTALGHVVVHRVIAPVILRLRQTGLIDRGIVKRGQDMHGVDAQVGEVVDGSLLGQGKIFTLVLDVARLVNREVPVVHLINDEVLGRDGRPCVGGPSLRIGLRHVDDGTALAVHADCGGPHTGALAAELTVVLHVEGVELALQVLFDRNLPQGAAVNRLGALHVDRLDGLAVEAVIVDAQLHLLGIIVSLKREGALGRAVGDPSTGVGGLSCGENHNYRYQLNDSFH